MSSATCSWSLYWHGNIVAFQQRGHVRWVEWFQAGVSWLSCLSQATVPCVTQCFNTRYSVQFSWVKFAAVRDCTAGNDAVHFSSRWRANHESDWLCCWLQTYIDSHFTMYSWTNGLSVSCRKWSWQVSFIETRWLHNISYRSIMSFLPEPHE